MGAGRTVLELLERHKVTATFFILGWIAGIIPTW
jgi:peptidoglycan/xylan/chitin deacetylase (PgdA/CDA1 family)